MRSLELPLLPWFVQPMATAPRTPWISVSHTWELDKPYRFCPKTVVLNMPGINLGVAFGKWRNAGGYKTATDQRKRAEESQRDAEYNTYLAFNDFVPRWKWEAARRYAATTAPPGGWDHDEEIAQMQKYILSLETMPERMA